MSTVVAQGTSLGKVHGILIMSLVTACGCKCAFCGLPDSRPHTVLSGEALVAALEGAPAGGRWEEVNITGGDPLVIPAARRLFPALLARRHYYDVLSVSTAGVPAKAALLGLDALDDGSPLDIYVSLDGVGELHDRIRRRPGAFTQVSRFLREAGQRRSVSIALTCVINRMNVEHLDEVADHAEELGLPISYAVVNSSDHYIRSLPLYNDVSLSPKQSEQVIQFLTRRSKQRLDSDLRGVLRGDRRKLPCRLLHKGVLLTSDGAAAICGTSQRMILTEKLPDFDIPVAWAAAQSRRSELLASGVAEVCQTCTTNCFAWRNSDGPVPG
jgi:MoaA/NifB/PqqE/SkfB family radical SAM enzyme